jgi:hypothetical protein
MQDLVSELPRTPLLGTSVNSGPVEAKIHRGFIALAIHLAARKELTDKDQKGESEEHA